MSPQRILVLTGDHHLGDSTKHGGAYSEGDLALHRAMCEAFESVGRFEVSVLNDHAKLFDTLRTAAPDLVVNFCDTGYCNIASQELHIAALLEMFDIPYTGAPPQAMVLAYDKSLVAMIARSLGIAVPTEALLAPEASVESLDVPFPAFVKPSRGDGSVGIDRRALVHNGDELAAQVAWLRETLPPQVLLIQEYLPGPEYGLALIGNPGAFRALPMLQVDFSNLPDGLPQILAFESKTGPSNPYDDIGIARATLDAETVGRLTAHAERLFERLGCRDYARFDFRAAAEGTIKLMEVNPNPAWSREAKLARMANFDGLEYPQLMELLVDTAWARHGAGR